ncbi:MAG: YebC/PmpR family DNA-binding transcriptional regulator [Bacteroidales bacterium]|nr:YebC/PmpR family DNA-binding transcriptional regulator [Bacteroidales bacterium]
MSGHSKWSTIKHKKGAADAKRGKIFTRIIKEITIAARDGGGDPDINPRLRLAVQNAKGANMPKDNIERAIKKATDADATNYQEYTFEGYAANGIAVFVECMSDNNNRTVSSVRSAFNKHGGNLGTNGSLAFLFDRMGIFTIAKSDEMDMDAFELELIDGGAEEIDVDDEVITVVCAMEDFGNLNKKLEEMGIEPVSADLQRIPNDTKELDIESSRTVLRLIDHLEDDDDVQNVFHNLEMTDELAAELS